jgi:hypothetical protein
MGVPIRRAMKPAFLTKGCFMEETMKVLAVIASILQLIVTAYQLFK